MIAEIMDKTFRIFLLLSFSGALLIMVLLLLRPAFRKRFSKKWQCYIWLAVIARLLLPFAPENNLYTFCVQPAQKIIRAPSVTNSTPDTGMSSVPEPVKNGESADMPFLTAVLQNLWAL